MTLIVAVIGAHPTTGHGAGQVYHGASHRHLDGITPAQEYKIQTRLSFSPHAFIHQLDPRLAASVVPRVEQTDRFQGSG